MKSDVKVLHIINNLTTGGAEKLLSESLLLYKKYKVQADILLLSPSCNLLDDELRSMLRNNIFLSKYSNLYNPLHIFEIRKYIKKYDVINVHLFPCLYWVAIAVKTCKTTPPIIFTEHSTHNRRINNRLLLSIDKVIYSHYNKIIAITPQVKKMLVSKLGLNKNKIVVIYNGVNIEKYQIAKSLDIKNIFFKGARRILIQVSSFSPAKDQKTVIRSLAKLPDDYCLILVGDGELKEESIALTELLQLDNRVKFLGNRTDVPELLKSSDIVIQSSNWEGFGLAAVEGMAAGKPVIASDVPGLSNIIEDAGVIFETGNENDLANKILSLESNEKYSEVARKCVERAYKYNLKYMVESNIKLYRSTISETKQ